ncbi:hypothetical protein [Azospirillum argentinense]
MPHLRARPVRPPSYDSTTPDLCRRRQPAVVRRGSAREPPAPKPADATNPINVHQNINRDLHEYPSMMVGPLARQL